MVSLTGSYTEDEPIYDYPKLSDRTQESWIIL